MAAERSDQVNNDNVHVNISGAFAYHFYLTLQLCQAERPHLHSKQPGGAVLQEAGSRPERLHPGLFIRCSVRDAAAE